MAGKRTRTLIYTGTSFLAFLTIVYFFWFRPNQQLNNAKDSLTSKEFIELKGNIRTGLAQALGGAALLIGLGFTWRSIKAAEKNLTIAQENIAASQETAARNIAIALEGQITDRFTKAIAQLGDDKLEVRLGAIYALERIANDSEKDYSPIMEILTAFVRGRARWQGGPKSEPLPASLKPPEDIQAVLGVIKRRRHSFGAGETNSIDLRGTDLRNADLIEVNLIGAHFRLTHLEGALMFGAKLDQANLSKAYLDDARLEFVTFSAETLLKEASFEGTYITEPSLKDATLTLEQKSAMKILYPKKVEGATQWVTEPIPEQENNNG